MAMKTKVEKRKRDGIYALMLLLQRRLANRIIANTVAPTSKYARKCLKGYEFFLLQRSININNLGRLA